MTFLQQLPDCDKLLLECKTTQHLFKLPIVELETMRGGIVEVLANLVDKKIDEDCDTDCSEETNRVEVLDSSSQVGKDGRHRSGVGVGRKIKLCTAQLRTFYMFSFG